MKSFYAIFLSLAICLSIFPQEKSKNPSYALSFGIADNFRLDKFDGEIAVKKIIDNNHQLRFFVSPRISTYNQEDKTSANNSTRESKIFEYSIGVGADYLWKLISNEDFNMYGGTGLAFTYGNNNDKATSTDNNNKNVNEVKNPFTSIGIRGILGVEWKVTDKIGIHSEYLLSGSYTWRKMEFNSSINNINNPTTTRTSSAILLGSGVLFGISIYL